MENNTEITEASSYLIPEYMTPLTRTGYLLTAIYLTFVGIIATVGNVGVICVLVRYGTFRKRAINLLLINMAISDLGVSITGYPMTTLSGYWGRWLFGDVGCQFYAFCVYTLSCSTITTHAVVAIYRYIYIVKANLRPKLTVNLTCWVIMGIWSYSLFWTVTPFIGWSSYVYETFGTSCSINWFGRSVSDITYMVACTIGVFLVQIIIMIFCYYYVAKRIRGIDPQRMEERDVGVAMFGKFRARDAKIDIHVTKMCFMSMIGFIIVWTPYAVMSLWAAHVQRISAIASVLPTMFAKSSCMINPIIFLISSSKFRRDLKKMWCCSVNDDALTTRERSEQRSYFVRQSTVVNPNGNRSASVYYDKERIFIGDLSASRIQKEAELLRRHPDTLSISSSGSSEGHFVIKHKPKRNKTRPPLGPKGPDMFLASSAIARSQSSSSTGISKNATSSSTSGTSWSRRSGRLMKNPPSFSRHESDFSNPLEKRVSNVSNTESSSRQPDIFTLEGAVKDPGTSWKI